ncbi:MAG: efflux RND transporter permease subunit [Kiritimatiellae bacterium]|nr:efflux RND transporter permease subunit [Kiritimatiellia bacterium]
MLLSNYAIRFRTAVFVFLLVLITAGISSYLSLPREGSPDITIPYVFVTSIYEGTAPEEMEKLITTQLEKKLKDVENVEEITSTSSESVSTIVLKFSAGEDIDRALQRVKDKVDMAKPDLPDDLDEPLVQSLNFSSDMPVYTFTLSGNTPLLRLKKMAEDLQDRIELLPGVKEVTISGVREREIRIELDLPRLIACNIPVSLVMQRLAEENKTTSAGNIEMEGDKFQVRVPAEFGQVYELSDILLTERDGAPIYLTDVATISDTFKDLESISRINGRPAVTIGIKKRTGENSSLLINGIKTAILDSFILPEGIVRTDVYDESTYVADMIIELENNIFTGFLFVIVILLLFMGGRNSLFVALAIPFSMLLAFVIITALGMTLNMIVLFSLVLSVGMLVDNAIVIVENIYRHRSLGLSKIEAARIGAAEVAWPVITSTLTTVAAFAPLLFWPDIMGQFMAFLPKTLIITLSSSLFVAIVINPAICSAFIKAKPVKKHADTGNREYHPIVNTYERLLRTALQNRLTVLSCAFAFLIFSFLFYAQFGLGVELFPTTDPRNATVELKFPQGAGIDRTDAVLRHFEEALKEFGDIKFYMTGVGSSGGQIGGGSGTHVGNIYLEFKDIHEREGNSLELITRIREKTGQVAGADLKVEKQEEGPPMDAPVAVEISGDDFETLARLSAEIKRKIRTIPGLVDLQDDLEDALPEIQFTVNRKKAALLGLTPQSIGLFLRASIYGIEVGKFRSGQEEYDITIRLPEDQRNTYDLIDQIFIPTPAGHSVALSALGQATYTGGRGAIKHKNHKRLVTLTANNQNRGVEEIIQDIQTIIDRDVPIPNGYQVHFAGDTEEMQKSGSFLSKAFLMALGLILVVLVIQFNSAILPLIILVSVLLSLIGVMWGLLIGQQRFSIIMTGVGVISLAGIVVNNAIVLIDCIVQRKREGLPSLEAIVDAGRTRLRPVMLTAITTILGLIPMAVGYSLEVHSWPPRIVSGAESSQWWAPMAWAVIFGLLVATLLTLVLVPVMFSLADSTAAWFKRHFGITDD